MLLSERRNIYLFYVLSGIMNVWFIASNWIYFWTKYINFGQLGWVDAVGFGFAVLLEIPSGAIADILGKRKTILFGMLAGTIGVFLITFSESLLGIFAGWMIAQFCYAFYSGAAEAIAFDTLVDLKDEASFDKVITKSNEVENYTSAITTFAGGFLYAINFRLPHMLWGMSFAFGIVCAFFLVEPKTDTETFSWKRYRRQLLIGFKEITQTGLGKYIGFFFSLIGVYYLYSWGFIRPAIATSFGFFAKEQSVILPCLTLLGALVIRAIPFIKNKISDLVGLMIMTTLMSVGFLLTAFPIGYWGIAPMILILIAGKLSSPWISIIVNRRIQSQYRATTLSTIALITKLPYVLIAILAGNMIQNGSLHVFNLWIAAVVFSIGITSYVLVYLGNVKKTPQ